MGQKDDKELQNRTILSERLVIRQKQFAKIGKITANFI